MNLYEKNLELFKNSATELYESLLNENSNYNSKVTNLEDQLNMLVELEDKRCFLHSIYNVNREIKEMFRGIDNNVKVLVLFGAGFCHAIEFIKKNFNRLERLVIVEPDLNVFKSVLKKLDIWSVFGVFKQVSFIVNRTDTIASGLINNTYDDFYGININMVCSLSYRTLYPNYYETLYKDIISQITKAKGNLGAKELFKTQWIINTFRNIKKTEYMFDDIVGKYKNKVAIVVSAGPSLNKNIELLNQIKGKAIISPVGSAIKILHNHGIKPDFRFAFDGGVAENKIFEDIDTEICPLIYTDRLYYEILDNYKGPKVKMIANTDSIIKYIYHNAEIEYTDVVSGFSIANAAVDALIKMGVKTIVFTGQDMSYSEGKRYANKAVDMINDINTDDPNIIETVDLYGNKVYTNKLFFSVKEYFENVVADNPSVRFLNATEGGLVINGAENVTLQNVLSHVLKETYDFSEIFSDNVANSCINERNEKVKKVIFQIEDDIKCIQNINDNRIMLLKKLKKDINKNYSVSRLLNDVEFIEHLQEELVKIDLYKSVLVFELENNFRALEVTFEYNGNDQKEKIEAQQKILIAQAAELLQYLNLILELIKEYKSEIS